VRVNSVGGLLQLRVLLRRIVASLASSVSGMTGSSGDVTANERFYAALGPMATSVTECDSRYYAECLMGLLHEQVTVSVTRPDRPVWS